MGGPNAVGNPPRPLTGCRSGFGGISEGGLCPHRKAGCGPQRILLTNKTITARLFTSYFEGLEKTGEAFPENWGID